MKFLTSSRNALFIYYNLVLAFVSIFYEPTKAVQTVKYKSTNFYINHILDIITLNEYRF